MNTQYEFGDFVLDPVEGRLSKGEEVIRLTPRLLSLLGVLVERQGRLVEKQELLDRVWGGTFVSEANITVQMSRLRRALGETEAQPFIETVPTRGYRFLVPVRVTLVDRDRTTDLSLPPPDPAPASHPARTAAAELGIRSRSDPEGDHDDGESVEKATDGSVTGRGSGPVVPVSSARAGSPRARLWWRIGLTAAGAALVGLVFWLAPSPRSSASAPATGDRTRLTTHLADDGEPALSPDGKTLAFVSNRAGQPELYVLELDGSSEPRRISPSVASGPAWSPDGTHLAFACVRSGQFDICVIDRDARRERVVVGTAGDDTEPAWSPDSARLAFVRTLGRRHEVHVTDASGDAPSRRVSPLDWSAQSPSWSPDGQRLVVARQTEGEDSDLAVLEVDLRPSPPGQPPSTTPVILTSGPSADGSPVWAPDGERIAFARADGLAILDTADGTIAPVAGTRPGDRHPAWSADGRFLIFQSARDGNRELYRAAVPGARLTRRLTDSLAADQDPAWSPDGTRLAFASNRDGRHELYLINADGSGLQRLTTNDAPDLRPAWSPDGRWLAFMREQGGRHDIHLLEIATRAERRLEGTLGDDSEPAWSPDGTRIAFNSPAGGNFDIYVMGIDGSAPVNITDHPARDTYPAWSPDGRSIVFASNRDKSDFFDNDLYIVDLETRQTRRITTGSAWDAFPAWSRSGRIAFVRSVANRHDIVIHDVASGRETALTVGAADEDAPAWSPDGRQVAYFSNRAGNADVYVQDVPP